MSLQEIAILSGPIFHIHLNRDFTLDCDNFQLFILFRVKASLQWRAGCMTQRKEGTKEFRIALVTLSSWPDKRAWKKSEERLHHAILCMQYTGLCALLCVCERHDKKRAHFCSKIFPFFSIWPPFRTFYGTFITGCEHHYKRAKA